MTFSVAVNNTCASVQKHSKSKQSKMNTKFYFVQTVLLHFIFIISRARGFGINLMNVPDDDHSEVVCTIALLKKYFNSGEPLSGAVLYMSVTTASVHTQKCFLDAMHSMTDFPWSIVIRDPKSLKSTIINTAAILHEKPQCYFLVIENIEDEDLEDIFEDWKRTLNWNPLAQFVVYLATVEETDEEMTELMIEILLSFMNKKIYNVNVIGQNEENGYYYGKTVFPYHPDNNCGNRVISIETLDVCDYQGDGKTVGNHNDEEYEDGGEENWQEENTEAENNGEDYTETHNDNNDDDNGKEDSNNNIDQSTNVDEMPENVNGNDDDENENEKENATDVGGNVNDEEENSDNATADGSLNENEPKINFNNDGNAIDINGSGDDGNNSRKKADNDNENEDENGDDDNNEKKNTNLYKINDNGKQSSSDEDKERESEKEKKKIAYDKNDVNVDSLDLTSQEGNSYNDDKKSDKTKNINQVTSIYIYKGNDLFSKGFREHFNTKLHENGDNNNENENEESEKNIANYDKSSFQADVDLIKNINKETMSKFLSYDENKKHHKPNKSVNGKGFSTFKGEMKISLKAKKVKSTNYISRNNNKLRKTKSQKNIKFERISKTQKTRYKRESNNDLNNTIEKESPTDSNLYVEEIYRALFLDKFPKDLSGCSLVAAFRPWEPYIFREKSENKVDDYDSDENNLADVETVAQVDVEKLDNNENVNGNDDNVNEAIVEYDSSDNATDYENTNVAEENVEDSETAYDSIPSESEIFQLNGIEYKLLQTIGESLHINIDLQFENSNPYLLFQQLIDGEVEMVIGGIDEDPSISQFVSTTIPYHQDDLTWCVAKARRSHNLFNFLASFAPMAWLLTFVFAIVAALTINVMQKFLKLRLQRLRGYFGILFRMFGIIFSQSVPLVKMPTPIRITLAMAFLLGFLFVNAYQSFLISTLTTPKSAYQISRVEEIYQHRMKIMGSVENVRHLSKPGEVFKYIREKFQMCYNIEECLQQAAENDRLAVAVSRQHSFYNPRIPRNQLYCFDRNENLYVYLVTMLLPKKFHLLHKINPVIQYIIESGHMQKWARDLDMRRHILEERNRVIEDAFRSLTLGQVAGTFAFTGVLLVFSFVVFILECWVHKLSTRRHRRTRIKIIKFLHRKFQSI